MRRTKQFYIRDNRPMRGPGRITHKAVQNLEIPADKDVVDSEQRQAGSERVPKGKTKSPPADRERILQTLSEKASDYQGRHRRVEVAAYNYWMLCRSDSRRQG